MLFRLDLIHLVFCWYIGFPLITETEGKLFEGQLDYDIYDLIIIMTGQQ